MEAESVHVAALQFDVSMEVGRIVATVENLLAPLPRGTLAVTPEGALSGYRPEPHFVDYIDENATHQALDRLAALCRRQQIHLIAGACIRENGSWFNSSFHLDADGNRFRYDKINLAQGERGTFTPGYDLPVVEIGLNGTLLRLGIQMCREIRYPEQWRMLAVRGAQIIAYVNNAAGSQSGDGVWRAHMISRAAETQRFVVGANAAASDQKCPTLIVSPAGEPLAEVPTGVEGAATASIDLAEVSDWVLSQSRDDVVRVVPIAGPTV